MLTVLDKALDNSSSLVFVISSKDAKLIKEHLMKVVRYSVKSVFWDWLLPVRPAKLIWFKGMTNSQK